MAALLPWRRSKFVLVEHDEKKDRDKGKSLGLSLNYTSLLSNLVRSCPDLWPPYPFERWSGVFRSRRQKVELNKEDPTYTVWYLGNAITLQAKGTGCTDQAVDKIWAKSEFGGHSTKMKLTLGLQGIHMRPGEKEAHRPGHAYLLHRITYCGADGRHPKIFTWVYRHQVKNKAVVLRCHAVLLSKAEEAQAMALLLYQTSYSAFNEFKRLQRQSDSRRLQRKLLGEAIVPLVPLRRLLNSKCPYRPPLDRSRNAPKLSSIQEEEEEEESPRKTERPAAARVFCFPRHCTSQAAACEWFAIQTVICTMGGFGLGDPASRVEHTSFDHKAAATIQDAKTAGCQEQLEMQILAQEFRFCTLRRPLPVVGTTSWKLHQESPCLSC